jgi:phosphoglycolate phosphatase-like HAD superfamily hydrolase
MNLVMLDIDGTLTQSYDYDKEIFGLAIGEVLGCAPVDADVNGYIDKTSTGVTEEAIRRVRGTNANPGQMAEVKQNVLRRLEKMYQEAPGIFDEVPGAQRFLEHLRELEGIGIAIATGCWREEALFKLRASGLNVAGIPMATSDDDRKRARIMQRAEEKARDSYACQGFERVVYLGDGQWDLQEAQALDYGFIGIGPRIKSLIDSVKGHWHPDFLEVEAVLTSVMATLKR